MKALYILVPSLAFTFLSSCSERVSERSEEKPVIESLILSDWINQEVTVYFNDIVMVSIDPPKGHLSGSGETSLNGKLTKFDRSGVVIKHINRSYFIPSANIRSINKLD